MAGAWFSQKKSTWEHAFSSKEAFIQAIEVKDTSGEGQSYEHLNHRWLNEDLEPTPPEKRTWSFWTYCAFYWGLSFGNWNLGSTMVGIGLNWWQAILVILISQCISSLAMAWNSRCSSVYHLGYPAVARSVFGLWGSFYFVGARAALAIVWYGVQLYTGASYMANMLRAIFGHYYADIPNHIPASVGITSSGMLAFFLFWLLHFGFCFFRPYQLKKFFWFKGFIIFPAVFGLFIFCMVNTHGKIGGALPTATYTGGMGWFFMHAINSGMGNSATLITNQPDIARWSKTKLGATTATIVQPVAVTVSATFGILATAAINNAWGLSLWNPWDLLDAIMDRYWSGGARFAIFLCALTWTASILGTNIAANMIPFGADSAMLWPRYIDMKRGFFIVEFLGFAICPWKILASAATFTTFLSGYGLFMASVVAIMVADYFFINNGNVFVPFLYDPSKTNPHYYYHRGWNVQALIAYIVGIALPFPGFCWSLGATGVSPGGQHMFEMGWILSFFTSLAVYTALCKIWPTKTQKLIKEQGLGWEVIGKIQEDRERELTGEEGVAEAVEVGDQEEDPNKGTKDITVAEKAF